MEASRCIRESLNSVAALRAEAAGSPPLASALHDVKKTQARRFTQTYADLLASPTYVGCATFFLQELYSERDYSARDAQFAKVASVIELSFPAPVITLALTLAQLHEVTEQLDMAMARAWLQTSAAAPGQRYATSWATVGQPEQRQWQLETVLGIGSELSRVTRKKGLRLMLKVMRRPAELAGLGALQQFLESGFDHFSTLTHTPGATESFLATIQERESEWLHSMFAPGEAGGRPQ